MKSWLCGGGLRIRRCGVDVVICCCEATKNLPEARALYDMRSRRAFHIPSMSVPFGRPSSLSPGVGGKERIEREGLECESSTLLPWVDKVHRVVQVFFWYLCAAKKKKRLDTVALAV